MKKILILTMLLTALLVPAVMQAAPETGGEGSAAAPQAALEKADEKEKPSIDAKAIIFDHLGDRYGWEVPFNHHAYIPLPVIVKGMKGWHVFMSSKLEHGHEYEAADGSIFKIAGEESEYKGKVVEVVDGKEIKPWDISITKNVCAALICVFVVVWMILGLARWYKTKGMQAPRGFRGAVESLVMFIYDGVIKPTLKDKATKFAPYLLTVFMFIFVMNLLGLVVIFPGGANLTGNIAVTMVLAIITFLVTNIWGTKHYWKEIFWPDVPLWLKFPIPIMPIIELFGIFTKPAALTVRLFANMMGGHMIVIVLTLLIFIFGAIGGAVVGGGTTALSVVFSLFMLLIDVLVSFIQAYVFTMLSTIFISLAQENGHHEKEHKPSATEQPATVEAQH